MRFGLFFQHRGQLLHISCVKKTMAHFKISRKFCQKKKYIEETILCIDHRYLAYLLNINCVTPCMSFKIPKTTHVKLRSQKNRSLNKHVKDFMLTVFREFFSVFY